MIPIIIITILVLANTVKMETCEETNQLKIIDFVTKLAVDIQKDCGNDTKPCVMKCCPENEVLYKTPNKDLVTCRNLKYLSIEYTTTAIQELSDYSDVEIDSGSQMSFFEDFRVLYSDRFVSKACSTGPATGFINENGTAYFNPYEGDPALIINIVAPQFCMDKMFGLINASSIGAFYVFYYKFDDPQSIIQTTTFLAYGSAVSAFFLFLVFVIHCLLKFLNGNPKGKNLMGFVFSMMLYYVHIVWYSFSTLDDIENQTDNTLLVCKWVSPIAYFTYVSAFYWLNAMCHTIYRRFRSFKLRSLESDDKKKMWIYSAYALGVPLLCTIVAVLIDQYGSDQVRPGFDSCMRDDENYLWKRLYVRLPTGLVILSNVVMWVLTMRNVHSVRVQFARTAREESTHTRKGGILANGYGKLFIVMGVTWMIELIMIPFTVLEDWVFYLTNLPNSLLGVWIFLVTVCSKKIFIKLCIRFGIENKWTSNINTTQGSQVNSTSRAKASNRKNNTD